MLTTITPYFNRPEALEVWIANLKGIRHPEVQHLLVTPTRLSYSIDSRVGKFKELGVEVVPVETRPSGVFCIGDCHNAGARFVNDGWIMKWDVDCLIHTGFFTTLLALLKSAPPYEYYNIGMFYAMRWHTEKSLRAVNMPLTVDKYRSYISDKRNFKIHYPQGSHFVCRTGDYLRLGGCDSRFEGYGWEDYQQLYMLERHRLGRDPFQGSNVTYDNVRKKCRDEIAVPRAQQIFRFDKDLAVIHRWHPTPTKCEYRNGGRFSANQQILFDYVRKKRSEHESRCEDQHSPDNLQPVPANYQGS